MSQLEDITVERDHRRSEGFFAKHGDSSAEKETIACKLWFVHVDWLIRKDACQEGAYEAANTVRSHHVLWRKHGEERRLGWDLG